MPAFTIRSRPKFCCAVFFVYKLKLKQ